MVSAKRDSTSPRTCTVCSGAGIVQELRQSFFGQMMVQSPCANCSGFGSIIEEACETCVGSGMLAQDITLEVNIPAGVETGSRLRLTGQGPVGPRGSQPGDLYVSIFVEVDENFERHGDDLVGVQKISFLSAIFGVNIPVDTLDGSEVLHVPSGSKSGDVFKLHGQGMGRLRGRGRGDILIYINVENPSVKDLSEEQKDLLKEYAKSRGEEIQEIQESHSLFEKVKRAFS